MLFLAAFAGFLAENEREHFSENKREKTCGRNGGIFKERFCLPGFMYKQVYSQSHRVA